MSTSWSDGTNDLSNLLFVELSKYKLFKIYGRIKRRVVAKQRLFKLCDLRGILGSKTIATVVFGFVGIKVSNIFVGDVGLDPLIGQGI